MKNHSVSKPSSNTARESISELRSTIEAKYWSNAPIRQLLQEYSQGIDKILTKIWLNHFEANSNSALYAVGGYGRGELHPHSDIDLLLVSENLDQEKSTASFTASPFMELILIKVQVIRIHPVWNFYPLSKKYNWCYFFIM